MTEIEKKFIIKAENFEFAKQKIKGYFSASWKKVKQHDTYFDTAEFSFLKNQCSLRMRETSGGKVYTLKQNAKSEQGILIRDEIELCQTIFDSIKVNSVLQIESVKEKGIVNFENAEFEISIDETEYISKGITSKEYILEIELHGDQINILDKFCNKIIDFSHVSNSFLLKETTESKYERGFIHREFF